MPTPFTTHSGSVLPLDMANVDTDQIIPKQFLTAVTRRGFAKYLFHDWRYLDKQQQQPNPDFILNAPRYTGASILLTRENFGCGSSREHAPWALAEYGFKVIIAESFADIFYANCLNNQVLPIVLSKSQVDQLFALAISNTPAQLQVDLPNQQLSAGEHHWHFAIAPEHKTNLLKGLDAIGQTLQYQQQISDYEQQQPDWLA